MNKAIFLGKDGKLAIDLALNMSKDLRMLQDRGYKIIIVSCRKPTPGMLIKAAKDLKIDLEESWLVGDILKDVETGKKAGCRTILVDNKNSTEWFYDHYREPDYQVEDLLEAARIIVSQNRPLIS